ncbi:RNA polymerase sigma factor SigJ [Mycolicibacterium sp. GCM10028919]|uniref:RNA polymerase sigma factor SigJ n=1 Tax=Mycolicibacterium sp. GCM10028919 TaxID=3273401 RepID=UPI0036235A1E
MDTNVASPVDVGQYRKLLFSVAFRLLGSTQDAEDMVQEAYARWFAMDQHAQSIIEVPQAWLVRVTSHACLDQLRSARVRREAYVGDWLPEPVPTSYLTANLGASARPCDPVQNVTLDESVSTALLVLLEEVTPAERVTFILHDVFGVPFKEIADIVGRSPAACRQLAVSARRHVRSERYGRPADARAHSAVVSAFKTACISGNLEGLARTLAPDVVVRVDGGGKTRAALRPVIGSSKVARFVRGIVLRQEAAQLVERSVNGQPGILLVSQGRVVRVYSFDVVDGKIARIWIVANPDKLGFWNVSVEPSAQR